MTHARVRPGLNIIYVPVFEWHVVFFYTCVCMCVIYVYVLCMFINTCAYCSGVRYSQYSLRALEGDLTRYKIWRLRVGTVETPPGWECFPGTCGLVGSWESLLFCLDDKLKSKIMVILDFITQGLINLKWVTFQNAQTWALEVGQGPIFASQTTIKSHQYARSFGSCCWCFVSSFGTSRGFDSLHCWRELGGHQQQRHFAATTKLRPN